MTTIETIITCDECGEAYCNGDLRNETAAQQREGFRNNGWHRSKGLDVCPRCWKARAFPAVNASGMGREDEAPPHANA